MKDNASLKDNQCLLAIVDQRLYDCLNLWIETKDNYFDPNKFRLSLNNTIQAFRNVTFILQKIGANFEGFSEWYQKWQEIMRLDSVLKWIISARNIIVKEGDLITYSILRIAIVESWYEPPIWETTIPPLTDTERFAQILANNIPNSVSLDIGLLRVERRWVDSQFPDNELLDSLKHAFEFFNKLVFDAHKKLLGEEAIKKCSWYNQQISTQQRIPSVMISSKWDRTILVDIKSKEILKPTHKIFEATKEGLERARHHYPSIAEEELSFKTKTSIEEQAISLFQIAKNMLLVDGYHIPIAFLGYPDGKIEMHPLVMSNRTEKHLIIRQLAADIESSGADSVILINEAWVASQDEEIKFTREELVAKNRKEVLQLIFASANGKIMSRGVFFVKDNKGKVQLGEESDFGKDGIFLIAPILKIWQKNKDGNK